LPAGHPPRPSLPEVWSPDGRYLIERVVLNPATLDDLWVQPLGDNGLPGDQQPFPYLQSEFNERNAAISPDGKWCAYTSDESGRYEVYVQSFPKPGGKIQISTEGGDRARWSRAGTELFFIAPDRQLMAVAIRRSASPAERLTALDIGKPIGLFQTNIGPNFNIRFDVSKDGRFLIPVQIQEAAASSMTVLLNWPELLKK
jgi:hypothetical protein